MCPVCVPPWSVRPPTQIFLSRHVQDLDAADILHPCVVHVVPSPADVTDLAMAPHTTRLPPPLQPSSGVPPPPGLWRPGFVCCRVLDIDDGQRLMLVKDSEKLGDKKLNAAVINTPNKLPNCRLKTADYQSTVRRPVCF